MVNQKEKKHLISYIAVQVINIKSMHYIIGDIKILKDIIKKVPMFYLYAVIHHRTSCQSNVSPAHRPVDVILKVTSPVAIVGLILDVLRALPW